MNETRFPRRLYAQGTEPDARFSFANERTFLAWITTGLALLSVGVAVASFAVPLSDLARGITSGVLVAGAAVMPALAWITWWRAEAALRRGAPLPTSVGIVVVGVIATVVAVTVGVDLLLP